MKYSINYKPSPNVNFGVTTLFTIFILYERLYKSLIKFSIKKEYVIANFLYN